MRRRYERLVDVPDGILVIGDALCSFDPAFGQGMSTAALEAVALRTALGEGRADLGRRFFHRAAQHIDTPWQIVVGGMPPAPGTSARKPLADRLVGSYLTALRYAGVDDPTVARAFLRVAHMTAPPQSLMAPRIAARVFAWVLLNRAAVAGPGPRRPPDAARARPRRHPSASPARGGADHSTTGSQGLGRSQDRTHLMKKRTIAVGAVALATAGLGLAQTSSADASGGRINFELQRSPGIAAAGCLPYASARVTVKHDGAGRADDRRRVGPAGQHRVRHVRHPGAQRPVRGVVVPGRPGDQPVGFAHQEYVGRFNQETFAIAPNTAPAPSVHSSPTPDATSNPAFGPIHTFHVGIWFNSPADATKAGCSGATTPVQRGAQRRGPGLQHRPVPGHGRPAGHPRALTDPSRARSGTAAGPFRGGWSRRQLRPPRPGSRPRSRCRR